MRTTKNNANSQNNKKKVPLIKEMNNEIILKKIDKSIVLTKFFLPQIPQMFMDRAVVFNFFYSLTLLIFANYFFREIFFQ